MAESFHPDVLAQVDIFSLLPREMSDILAPYFQVQSIAPNETVFGSGESHQRLCVILEGEVALLDTESDPFRDREFVTFGPGRVLGESILFEDREGSYALTAQAVTDVTIAQMSRQARHEIEKKHPKIYAQLLQGCCRVLQHRTRNASRGGRGRGAAALTVRTREEYDLLGYRDVPAEALWGVQTLRAMENFQISGVRLDYFPAFIESLSAIKRACAIVNYRLDNLDEHRANAIVQACDEIQNGLWHGHFVVDVIQGGAGTSTNMNANEVIANRALQLLQMKKGCYQHLHPNTHVNMSQSTNDVYPSALKIALLRMLKNFLEEVELLAESFMRKGGEFRHVLKMGRTQLQDAVPMSLGQEFSAWARTIREGGKRIAQSLERIGVLNIGGTAIGTGINTDSRYATMVVEELCRSTGLSLQLAPDLVEGTQDTSSFVELAGVLKMLAVRLSKICNDLRLLSSGPRCGFNEINLPAVQPGSSIMPGKVNPVIPEVVNQVAFLVIGLDTTVALASEAGQLELNVFEPVIAFTLFTSIRMMRRAMSTLRLRCIDGITANEDHCRDLVHHSIGIVTALNPHLGYEQTSLVAKEALRTGRPVYEIVLEKGYMDKEDLDRALDPKHMIQPRRASHPDLKPFD